jgi:predicted nucleic acid-binding protein
MPVEPGIVDANVLVYALDADAPQHSAARAERAPLRDNLVYNERAASGERAKIRRSSFQSAHQMGRYRKVKSFISKIFLQ